MQKRARGEQNELVSLDTVNGVRTRVVSFIGDKEGLLSAVLSSFKDVLHSQVTFFYIQDDSWGENVFVELIDLEIPDRSVIKVVETLVEEMQFEVAYCKTRNSASEFQMRFFD